MYTVYRILFPNSKSYIGWTAEGLNKRKDRHLLSTKNGSNFSVHNALRKYNGGSVLWEVLYETSDKEFSLTIMEPYFIRLYGSHYSTGRGYNMTLGGDGRQGVRHTIKSKQKMSKSHRGHTYNRGRTPSRAALEASAKVRRGIPLSDSHKQKQSESIKKNPRIRYWLGKSRNFTLEHRKNLSKPQSKVLCPHCQLSGGISSMKRWHFDKCKRIV